MEDVEVKDLTGMFLIAVPSLKDPNFEHTVVLICDHSKDGAFGLVINRTLLNSFVNLLDWLDIKESVEDMPVFYGGPVKPEQGYILFILGFSGWSPGQLEYELMIDSWLVAPIDKRIIFDVPVNERWRATADSIGIDFTRLVDKQGRV